MTQLSTTVLFCVVHFKVLFFTWVLHFMQPYFIWEAHIVLFTSPHLSDSWQHLTSYFSDKHFSYSYIVFTGHEVWSISRCLDFECLWCSVPLLVKSKVLLITSLWTQINCILQKGSDYKFLFSIKRKKYHDCKWIHFKKFVRSKLIVLFVPV